MPALLVRWHAELSGHEPWLPGGAVRPVPVPRLFALITTVEFSKSFVQVGGLFSPYPVHGWILNCTCPKNAIETSKWPDCMIHFLRVVNDRNEGLKIFQSLYHDHDIPCENLSWLITVGLSPIHPNSMCKVIYATSNLHQPATKILQSGASQLCLLVSEPHNHDFLHLPKSSLNWRPFIFIVSL